MKSKLENGKGNNLVGGSLWHFFRASELQQLAESCGLITLEMVGCEGLSTGLSAATNTVAEDPTKWELWVELVTFWIYSTYGTRLFGGWLLHFFESYYSSLKPWSAIFLSNGLTLICSITEHQHKSIFFYLLYPF